MLNIKQIKEKIPKNLQDKLEFGNLLSIIEDKKIKSINELNNYLNSEIEASRIWLSKNKQGRVNKLRRDYTKKLEILNKVKGITKYLE